MLLVIDIGNTNLTLGVFDEGGIIHSWRLSTQITGTEDEYGIFITHLLMRNNLISEIKEAVICSVVTQLTDKIDTAVKKYLSINPLIISHKIRTNVVLKTDNPYEIGADRIANSAAVSGLYKIPAIVVDFGTATTFDVVNQNNEFIGGIITAGMKLQAEALGAKTSKLPKLNIESSSSVIGHNTAEAMLSGIVRGHAAMIEGLIIECEKELGAEALIIATGGYSSIVSQYLHRKFDCINPDLTLTGAKILFDLNR